MLVLFAALEFDLVSKVLPCCNAVVSDHMILLCREERAAVRGGSCVPSAHGDKTPKLPLSMLNCANGAFYLVKQHWCIGSQDASARPVAVCDASPPCTPYPHTARVQKPLQVLSLATPPPQPSTRRGTGPGHDDRNRGETGPRPCHRAEDSGMTAADWADRLGPCPLWRWMAVSHQATGSWRRGRHMTPPQGRGLRPSAL